MFRVTREIHFCYGHRLLDYPGKCRFLHGHNAVAVITLEAPALDDLGMVLDFGEIKETLGDWIDEHLDHKMILHQDDPLLTLLRAQGEPIYALEANPTAENLARLIFEVACRHGFPVAEVRLGETPTCFASYDGPD